MARQARRTLRELTADEQSRLARARADVAGELPELARLDQLRTDAAKEQTLSGELRRAIHRSETPLSELARQAGTTPRHLDEFLTGEETLQTDVVDRLVDVLQLTLAGTAETNDPS